MTLGSFRKGKETRRPANEPMHGYLNKVVTSRNEMRPAVDDRYPCDDDSYDMHMQPAGER